MIIGKHFEFEAAHCLPDKDCYGACKNLHGHTYKLTIELKGNINNDGWVLNFKDFKNIVKRKIIDVLDHSFLNDIFKIPTAENMVIWIAEQLEQELNNNIKLKKIVLYETSNSYAKFEY